MNETGSTQIDLAKAVRESRASSGDVIVAEYQSHGRGRLDRSFIAPSGSALLFSFFISPTQKFEWGWLPLLASQAVHEALAPSISAGKSLSLKWPNDILLDDKKLAGLLCERVNLPDGAGVVVGIGINVSSTREELPIVGATSLLLEGIEGIDRNALLVSCLQNFTKLLRRWQEGDLTLVDEYVRLSTTIGRQVRIEAPVGAFREAQAIGVEPSGSLILDDGSAISVGDIVHLHRN